MLQVAAALPGGDPLAAALAAGETPSPEMVAASGGTESLQPAVAWACLTGITLAVAAAILLSAQSMLYRRVPLEKSPAALAERAQDILHSLGYSERPVDSAIGFEEDDEFLSYIAEHDNSKTRWDNLEAGPIKFWYRGSPRPLAGMAMLTPGTVYFDDPPLRYSGMTLVELTPRGHLTHFFAIPPQVERPVGAASSAPDWAPLFSAAGLDLSKWTPSQPSWTPPIYADARAAWTGVLPERPSMPMRIEAAAYQGKTDYFELIGPWTRPTRSQEYQPAAGEWVSIVLAIVLLLTVLIFSVLLARSNLRMGHGDRRGALRLGAFVLAAYAMAVTFGGHHSPDFRVEALLVARFLVQGVAFACFIWVLYIALELYVRRRWPGTLVSWNRLLGGGFLDPLVGRDVLAGCVVGAFGTTLERLGWFVSPWLGYLPAQPREIFEGGPFLGSHAIIADISSSVVEGLFEGLAVFFVLVLLRVLLRRDWAAAGVLIILFTVFGAVDAAGQGPIGWLFALISAGLDVFLLVRFGLLAFLAEGSLRHLLALNRKILQLSPVTTVASGRLRSARRALGAGAALGTDEQSLLGFFEPQQG